MINYRLLLFLGTALYLFSCSEKTKTVNIQADQSVQLDSLPGSAPYLTKDQKGHVVISWAQAINDSVSQFCYAISPDNGKSFGKPITIPGSTNLEAHSENLPKIIFKPSGEIIALWGTANPNPKNKYSGLVFYSTSFDDGQTWSKPKGLVSDTSSYDQRYYDVALLPNTEAAIIWLDNRKTTGKEGSTLYFASTHGKNGFENEQKIAEGCCQCCRTDLFIDDKAGIHVLYRGIIQDSIRDMLHSVSIDGGKTFSTPQLINNDHWVIAGCPHTGPAMTENKKGLHFAWFTGGNPKGCFYTESLDDGKTFIQHERISELGSHPQIAADTAGRLIIAWDESFKYNDIYNKKIGVQLRTEDGVELNKKYITTEEVNASYPVIAVFPDKTSLIAYTVKKGNKNYIQYQRISF